MGVENFIPTIWSAKIFVRQRKSLVFASVVNLDYQGDITEAGDTVKINEIGPIAVSDYTKDTGITWETLDSAQKTLLIDQQKYFAFSVDKIDQVQTKPKLMNAGTGEAAYAINNESDTHIAGKYAEAGVSEDTYLGTSGASVSVSSGNVILTLTYAQRVLNEANCPIANRWAILPPWMHQKLILSEVGGISATAVPKTRDDGVIMNGYIGQAMGFTLLMSNNVSNDGTQYRCMFGHRNAISYAGQIAEIDAVKREDHFDTGVKGLYVYGCKVVRPNALCTAYLAEAAG